MGEVLERQLGNLRGEEEKILGQIAARNSRKKIGCESCGKRHQISTLTLIQTHWYTPPSGCMEGDYWREGEIQFVCPTAKVANRLMFDNYDVPWEKRRNFENNPEEQFKRKYKPLFREVIESHEHSVSGERANYYHKDGRELDESEVPNDRRVNNYYVDERRKSFGLVEKRKS